MSVERASRRRADDLIEWLRGYAETRIDVGLMDERRCLSPHVVLDFAAKGMFGLLVPERLGGAPLPLREAFRVVEQLAAIDLTLGSFYGVDVALGIRPIVEHGTVVAQRRFVPALAEGRMLGGLALTEPGAGSNPSALASRAERGPDGRLRLFGHKRWIGNAAWSGVLNVFVRETDRDVSQISGFCVPADAPGLVQGPEHLTLGMRAMVQNEVLLKGVELDESLRLRGGTEALVDTLNFGRLGIAVLGLGTMQRCGQLLFRYASRRSIATGRLLEHPIARRCFAFIDAAVCLVRDAVDRLAGSLERRDPVDEAEHVSIKIAGPELTFAVVDQVLQLLGGRGYDEPNEVARRFRDARLLRIFEGPTEALQSHLGMRAMVDRSLPRLFDDEVRRVEVEELRDAAREATRDRRVPAAERRAYAQALAIELGDWVAFALLEQSCGDPAGRALAGERRDSARRRFESVKRRVPAPEPAALATRWAARIGDVELRAASERRQLDVLLGRDRTSHGRVGAPSTQGVCE